MKRKFALIVVLLILLGSRLLAEEMITLTLDEAIGLALRDNRDILIKQEDLKSAKEKVKEAQASLFPSLNATSSWTDTIGYYSKNSTNVSNQITLKQYLYRSGKTFNTINQNRYKENVSRAILDKTILETVLAVKEAFYTLLLTKEYARLNEKILENTKQHLESIQSRYANGQASESEVLKIMESKANVEYAVNESINQEEKAKVSLRNLLYLDTKANIDPEGELIYEPVEVAFDEVYLETLKSRPELRQYEAQEKADKLGVEITKADNRPSVYASWDYYSRSSATASNLRGWQDNQVVGVTFTWPIFDGFATKTKIEQALVTLKETKLLKEKTTTNITAELKTSYLDTGNSISKLKAKDQEITLYEDSLKVIEDKYKSGVASSLEVKDIRLGLEVAQFNKKDAVYDYLTAKARLDKAMGGM
jgi:outer membrane protein TolC